MESIALIITHLVAETNIEELKTSAEVFKVVNLTAAFDEHCMCHLEDKEDETPEIVCPGFATLFVSFTIWDSIQSLNTFQQKLKIISGINTENYISAQWSIINGKLPVLNEGFGRIWISRNLNLSSTVQSAIIPELAKSFGRSWLMENLGVMKDAFIYDHWEVRRNLNDDSDQPENSYPEKLSAHKINNLSFFKRPFGQTQNSQSDELTAKTGNQVNDQIQNFDQMMAGYNTELDKRLKEYLTIDYNRLATLVDWSQNIINIIVQNVSDEKNTAIDYSQFFNHVKSEERKWQEAQKNFVGQRDFQYNTEVQKALSKTNMYENSLEQQQKRMKIMNETNKELLTMHKDYMTKRDESFKKSNENWKKAHLSSSYF